MKNLLSKYGKHFWYLPLVVSIYAWFNFSSVDYPLDAIIFSGFTYYFFLKGTGRLTDKDDPLVN